MYHRISYTNKKDETRHQQYCVFHSKASLTVRCKVYSHCRGIFRTCQRIKSLPECASTPTVGDVFNIFIKNIALTLFEWKISSEQIESVKLQNRTQFLLDFLVALINLLVNLESISIKNIY